MMRHRSFVLGFLMLVSMFVAGAAGAQTVITGPDGQPVLDANGVPITIRTSNLTERVQELGVDITIQSDGSLRIVEDITYNFGVLSRRGIFRNIPVRYRYDDENDRVYKISNLRVSSPNAPSQVQTSSKDGNFVIRIGDPNRTVEGVRNYRIEYTVTGALNGFEDRDELFWNAVGADWQVPIERVTTVVRAPGPIVNSRCTAGVPGVDLACPEQSVDGSFARYGAADLQPGNVMTFAIAFPKGLVPTPTPILEERWSLRRAFTPTPQTLGVSGLLGIAVIGGLGLVLWRGRDRRFAGSAVDVAFGNTSGTEERVGLFENTDSPIEFVPPDGIRAGQLGTLIDETANPLDVTATIVDLAVRGYLRIDQIGEQGFFKKADWNLVKLEKPSTDLMPYERRLFDALFLARNSVKLSELKNTFASDLQQVQSELYDDMVSEGWYAVRPDRTRTLWHGIGIFAILASGGISFLLIRYTKWAIVSIPLVLGAIALYFGAKYMPNRTARGTAMLRRIQGFRQLFTEPEAARQQFAENNNIFSEYLPYAIVFGLTEKWAKTFEDLAVDPASATGGWYTSPYPYVWTDFGNQMDSFTVSTAGTIASTPAGSGASGFGGGDFGGGGGGGGGGGSW